MPWLPGKCPNCGGMLKVDSTKDAAVCEYCGSPFVTEKAIINFNNPNIYANNVVINNLDSDFEIVAGTLMKYKGASTIVRVPEGVVAVDHNCFKESKLTEIYLPSTLKEPVYFYKCFDIEKIEYPANYTGVVLGSEKCVKLKEITIPEHASGIGNFFGGGLSSISIPQNCLIHNVAFSNTQLDTVKISFPIKIQCWIFNPDSSPYDDIRNMQVDLEVADMAELRNVLGLNSPYTQTPFDGTPFINRIKSEVISTIPKPRKKGEGCYIATSIYGDYDCPQVCVLRRFRDMILRKSWIGNAFIKVYYLLSPYFVRMFGQKKWFNSIGKFVLDSMVSSLTKRGFEDTQYYD